MRRIVVCTNLSLDGVMQAPGRPDEDTRDGFQRGGWAVPYAAMQHIGATIGTAGGLLFGRRTYEDFFAVWPKRKESPFSAVLDAMPKYVASCTLHEPLPWVNSKLLRGEAATTVAKLKNSDGAHLVVMGSGELVRALLAARLVDEFVLLIHPLVLGTGRRLFGDDGPDVKLQLAGSTTTDKGVVIATYHPA
jgi:dihydrofolate reductase